MPSKLKAGDVVRVRSAAQILPTLDGNACLDGLPFMPEMLACIGKQYRVSKRAHKTCDTVHQTGGRRLTDCVHLEDLRCDGSNHDGCKATCLVFWKTAWLQPLQEASTPTVDDEPADSDELVKLKSLSRSATVIGGGESDKKVYRCQATALYDASAPLAWYDVRQYLEDWTSGNATLRHMLRVWFFRALTRLMGLGIGYGLWSRIYNAFQRRSGGFTNPFRAGLLASGEKTPTLTLNLQPGERIRIRSHDEILSTLNSDSKNRGMRFDPEMVPFCGKPFTVQRRVDRIIHETTGRMIEIKSPSVILDGVVCRSEMSACRLFCPRAIPSYWREIWLERIEGDSAENNQGHPTEVPS